MSLSLDREIVVLKSIVMMVFLVVSSLVHAAQPAAPLNAMAGQEVVRIFKQYYENDFNQDMSGIYQTAIPTAEQSYIYSKYMNKSFAKAGYSLDETIYAYMNSERTPGVVFFMSQLNLESYAISLKTDSVGMAFLQSGAISERTLEYAKNIARDVPIKNADYIFEGDSSYKVSMLDGVNQEFDYHPERLLGYVRKGSSVWEEWLYFESLTLPGEKHGMGLVKISEATPDEMVLWKALINKKVKMEGTYFVVKGVELNSNAGDMSINDPAFFDLRHDLIFKVL